jgi:hypothetical protein
MDGERERGREEAGGGGERECDLWLYDMWTGCLDFCDGPVLINSDLNPVQGKWIMK